MLPIIIAFVGASASGKSRLLSGIDTISGSTGLKLDVTIPERFTTRNRRDNETFNEENRFFGEEEFFKRVEKGNIDVYWRRNVGEKNKNYYGFSLKPHLGSNRTIILSGNNYLDWRKIETLQHFRQNNRFFVIRVVASDETRVQRLKARRPKLSDEEFAYRMADVPVEKLPPADFVICNDEAHQTLAPWEFIRILSFLKVSASYVSTASLITGLTEISLKP